MLNLSERQHEILAAPCWRWLATVLVEWFELVGRRLRAVQDTPATLALATIATRPSRVAVYRIAYPTGGHTLNVPTWA